MGILSTIGVLAIAGAAGFVAWEVYNISKKIPLSNPPPPAAASLSPTATATGFALNDRERALFQHKESLRHIGTVV